MVLLLLLPHEMAVIAIAAITAVINNTLCFIFLLCFRAKIVKLSTKTDWLNKKTTLNKNGVSLFMINFVAMVENDNIDGVKSVYRYGAEYGVWFGIYLTLMALAIIYGFSQYTLLLVAMAMFVATPAVIYPMMRRYRTHMHGFAPFASLWMLGLMIFLFGSLICGTVTYVWMQYVMPTFIYDQVVAAIEIYKTVPGDSAAEMVSIMETIIEHHALPSAMEVVVQMVMLTTFLGSLVSMALAFILGMRRIPPKNRFYIKK